MKEIHCCPFTNCNYGLLSPCRHVTHVEVVQCHLWCPFLIYLLLHVLLHSKYQLSSWSKCHMMVLSLSERDHSNEGPYLVSMVAFQNLLIPSSEQHQPLCWQCDNKHCRVWQQVLTARDAVTYHTMRDTETVFQNVLAVNIIYWSSRKKSIRGEHPRHCKPQWTRHSAEPVPVNIFMGVAILDTIIHITVSSVQFHMNGPTSPVKNTFIFKSTESPMQSGCFRTFPHVPLSQYVVANVHKFSAF